MLARKVQRAAEREKLHGKSPGLTNMQQKSFLEMKSVGVAGHKSYVKAWQELQTWAEDGDKAGVVHGDVDGGGEVSPTRCSEDVSVGEVHRSLDWFPQVGSAKGKTASPLAHARSHSEEALEDQPEDCHLVLGGVGRRAVDPGKL